MMDPPLFPFRTQQKEQSHRLASYGLLKTQLLPVCAQGSECQTAQTLYPLAGDVRDHYTLFTKQLCYPLGDSKEREQEKGGKKETNKQRNKQTKRNKKQMKKDGRVN